MIPSKRMKPTETLARARTSDGEELVLSRRDGVYLLSVDGLELMSSRSHGSEDALARLACAAVAERKAPRVLVAGLGFGYTLRAALDHLPRGAKVVVCEVFPSLLTWNRGPLAKLAGRPLDDPRVRAVRADVGSLLDGRERFDAILLDVDNGPEAFTLRSNDRLYTAGGLARLSRSLTEKGVLAVWSSAADRAFEERLRRAGFEAWSERAAARGGARGRRDTIFLARRR
jgi:spermidine synthase